MKSVQRLLRLLHINYILLKHGLDDLVLKTHLFRTLRFLGYFSPSRWNKNKHLNRGIRLRKACEDLGPIFVKFGQLLSTRLDLLPEDIAVELVKLQDQVPPFCGREARHIVESALNKPCDELFGYFSEKPLASASIAQVHAACLPDGREVVVKILRPNIKQCITRDIELLETLAKLAHRYWPEARRLRPIDVVAELRKCIFDEIDFQKEAANASLLRRNFYQSPLLYVPEVHWDYSRHNILVMERIYGTPVSNIKALTENQTNLKKLAERGVEIFFTQVFRDCFFHADMHPGNVWVSKEHPENPQYLALDFGIMGTLSAEDQKYLAGNFLAFFKRDYQRVAKLHIESGWVPKNTRQEEFESAIRSVCEPIFEKPLKEISFGKTLLRLFQTARRFDMTIQPQLILLQKTLISVEGLGRQLYPDLDLWHTAKPFLEDWMRKRIGYKNILKRMKEDAPYWLERLPELPHMLSQLVQTNPQLSSAANQTYIKLNASKNTWVSFFLGSSFTIAILSLVGIAYQDHLPIIQQHLPLISIGSSTLCLLAAILRSSRSSS